MKKRSYEISLKTTLYAFTILVTIIAVGLVGLVAFFGGRHSVNEIAFQLRKELTYRIEEHVRQFLNVPHLISQTNARIIGNSLELADDQQALTQRFAEYVDLFPWITSISFGNCYGGLANSGREPADDSRYIIITDDFIAGTFRKIALDSQEKPHHELLVLPNFDARSRGWYKRAGELGCSVWSDIYIIFTGQDMSLAVSTPVYGRHGELIGVVSADVFLFHLSDFLRKLNLGSEGQAFILDRSGHLVAASKEQPLIILHQDPAQSRRVYAMESSDDTTISAFQALSNEYQRLSDIRGVNNLNCYINGQKHIIQASSLDIAPDVDWIIVLVIPEKDFMGGISTTNKIIIVFTAAALLIAFIAGMFISTGIVRPIKLLDEASNKLASGSGAVMIHDSFKFLEVNNLTRSFNQMALELSNTMESLQNELSERQRAEELREKLQAQLNQAQKMESVGRLAGGVAHDFNNMLSLILGHSEMALDNVTPDQQIFADLIEIRRAAERSADITRQLLTFARRQTVTPKVLDLNQTLENMLNLLHRLIGENINLIWLPGINLWQVKIDPSQLDQILANLCINARDAIADVGRITIETGNTILEKACCEENENFVPGEYVLLSVSDNGCGIDKKDLANIFDPFFTTKEVGKGTGLGLAMVYGAVKQNKGFINVYSEPGEGTRFTIYLPRYKGKTAKPANKLNDAEPITGGQATILLVEDEPTIIKMVSLMLERQGYTVLAASSPQEGIRLAEQYSGKIDLLMTDVIMPEMNGRDLAQTLLSLRPDLKCLFMSGYTANVIAHHGVLDPDVYFIQKPFSIKELSAKIRQVLNHGNKNI